MIEIIKNKLTEIESKHSIRILYACESGSRAWGFASTDSDYDVRFIYQYTRNTYLSINEPPEQIELPINDVLDINGWDLRKTLRLFAASNAGLFEWLQSPFVYRKNDEFFNAIEPLMNKYFSPRKGIHHYTGVATNAYDSLHSNEIRIKKYFYCIRSILASMWITQKQEVPPMEFKILRSIIKDDSLQTILDEMLKVKHSANEKTTVLGHTLIHNFIETNLEESKRHAINLRTKENDLEVLNNLYRKLANEF